MTVYDHDIRALHHEMEYVLDDAELFLRGLKGQRKARNLVAKDVRHLRDQLGRLARHLEHLQRL